MADRTRFSDSDKKTERVAFDQPYEELIEQIAARLEAREPFELDVYLEQYPQYAEKLRRTIPAMQAMFELGFDSTGERSSTKPGEQSFTGTLGDYRIVREIGRGGMGVVYEAEEISLGRRVALKILPFAGMLDVRRRQRFQNEARAAATLEHAHIVPVYGVGQERGVHYYAMKLVQGRSLAQLINELRREANVADGRLMRSEPAALAAGQTLESQCQPLAALTNERSDSPAIFFRSVARLGAQAAEALAYAHSLGVTHRDIKPGNLLLDENGNSWITDFGLAQVENQPALTGTGDLVGTLRYMSPEQASGRSGQVDGRADIYGLGITLYELLTLQPAFLGDNRERILRRILEEDPPPPRQIAPAIPRDLETIVLKAIEKDFSHRFSTADELAEDLGRFLNNEPIQARRPGLWERGIKWCKRHQQAAISAAAFLLLLISVLGIAAVWINHERQRAVANMELAQQAAARQNQLRGAAEQSELRAQQLLYFADMKLAAQAWRDRNLPEYANLLGRHRPSNGQHDLRDFAWHYLWGRGHVAHQELSRHDDQVWCVRVSPDGQWIASAGADGLIHIRSSSGDQQHAIHMSARRSVSSIAFSPNSQELVSTSSDGYVRLWDVENGDERWAILAHEPDAYDSRVVYAADGELIASCGPEPEIRLWDADSGESRGSLRGHSDTIFGLAASPDEPLLASASRDETVRLLDLRSRSERQVLKGHGNRLTSLAFSPSGSVLASGATDRTVRLWLVESGEQLEVLKHLDEIGSVDFSADGRWLAVGDRNHSIHLWRVAADGDAEEPEQVPPQWHAHDGRVNSLTFLPHGRLLSGGKDGRVKIWEPLSDRTRRFVDISGDPMISDAAFTPDGQQLLLAGSGGVYVWSVAAGAVIARMDADLRRRASLAVAPDGTFAAVTDKGGKVVIWDLASASRIAARQLGGPESSLSRPSFSPDGSLLAVPNWTDDVLWIVDAASGQSLAELPARQCHDAVFSADASEVAVDGQNDIVIWDWAAGRRVRTLRGHDSTVNDLALSPDRRSLASASNDRQVKIWDWVTGEQRRSFSGHQDRVNAVTFSANGRLLISGDREGDLYVWHVPSGLQVCRLDEFSPRKVKSLAFASSGNHLACVLDQSNVVLLRGGEQHEERATIR